MRQHTYERNDELHVLTQPAWPGIAGMRRVRSAHWIEMTTQFSRSRDQVGSDSPVELATNRGIAMPRIYFIVPRPWRSAILSPGLKR